MKGKFTVNGCVEEKEFAPSELFFFDELNPVVQKDLMRGEYRFLCEDYDYDGEHEPTHKDYVNYLCMICEENAELFTKDGVCVELGADDYRDYQDYRWDLANVR